MQRSASSCQGGHGAAIRIRRLVGGGLLVWLLGFVAVAAALENLPAQALQTARLNHVAVVLPSGRVLVAGGFHETLGTLASSEFYDPVGGVWSATGSLAQGRYDHTATLLASGRVLVAGS